MADRTINININYKVNGQDVQKAAELSQRAQKATDDFRASAGKAGQSISQGFNQANRSIESMNIQLARLKTQISVASDPKQIAQLSNQYKVLKTQIDAANKAAFETPKAMKATQVAVQGASQSFGQLFTAVKLFLTAGIVKEVFDIGLNLASLQGNVQGVERAFEKSVANEVAVLNELRRATKGTITDFDLMKQALQAKNFGLPVEKLGKLLEFAAAKAQQTGLSIDYISNSLITGLGRNSVKIFDNLQLDIAELKKRIESGLDFRTAGIQLIEEDLQRMGGTMVTSATKVDRLKVAFEELRITLSKKIESGGLIEFFTKAIRGAEFLLSAEKRSGIEAVRSLAAEDAARIKNSESFKALQGDRQKEIDFIQQEINSRVQVIGKYNDSIKAKEEELKGAKIWSVSLQKYITTTRGIEVDAINKTIATYKINKLVVEETQKALKEYLAELSEVTEEEVVHTGIIERKQAEIEALEQAILKTNRAGDLGVGGDLIKKLEIAQAELADLQRGFIDFQPIQFKDRVKDVTKELLNLANQAEQTFKELSSFDTVTARIEARMAKSAKTKQAPLMSNITPTPEWEKAWEDAWRDVTQLGIDIQADQLKSVAEMQLQSLQKQLGQLRNYYDEQQILAGDNEKAKSQLRLKEERETTALQRRIFQKEKEVRRTQAIIDGAAAVIKTFAMYGFTPAGIIAAAGQAAITLSQIAIINRQQPRFAKGVIDLKGPGTGTSDSITAKLSKGESVITASATQGSKGLLKAIQNKKIDDNVLKTLHLTKEGVKQTTMTDAGIIAAIKSLQFPDVLTQADRIYKAEKSADGRHTRIRLKTMG